MRTILARIVPASIPHIKPQIVWIIVGRRDHIFIFLFLVFFRHWYYTTFFEFNQRVVLDNCPQCLLSTLSQPRTEPIEGIFCKTTLPLVGGRVVFD